MNLTPPRPATADDARRRVAELTQKEQTDLLAMLCVAEPMKVVHLSHLVTAPQKLADQMRDLPF